VTDPQQEHQFAASPPISCSDPRLSGLINLMMRKPTAGRPSLTRVISLLNTMIAQPIASLSAGANILAAAGAKIAAKEQAEQAAEQELKTRINERNQLLNHGLDILRQCAETLWSKISDSASTAQRTGTGKSQFSCTFGQASLKMDFSNLDYAFNDGFEFPMSKWNMLARGSMIISQANSKVEWPSDLWYGKQPGSEDYRWYELLYWAPMTGIAGLFKGISPKDVDFALSRTMHDVAVAYGPVAIDDENESDFHERCLLVLARAATGDLRNPSSLPLSGWPPNM